MDCRLWLFSDADFAGEYDAKSTTGCALFLVGPNTYYPINAFSKKQTSITMSSTESEVVSANQGVRAQGLPTLSLWYFLFFFHSFLRPQERPGGGGPPTFT